MARLGLVWDIKTHCGLYLVHGWLALGRFYHIVIYRNTIVVKCTTELKQGQLEHMRRDAADSNTIEYMCLQSEHKG